MLGEHQADNGFNTCHPIISITNQGSDQFNLDWFDEVVFPSSSHVMEYQAAGHELVMDISNNHFFCWPHLTC
jgi:hypothetical protein